MIGAHTCARIDHENGDPVSELMVLASSSDLAS